MVTFASPGTTGRFKETSVIPIVEVDLEDEQEQSYKRKSIVVINKNSASPTLADFHFNT